MASANPLASPHSDGSPASTPSDDSFTISKFRQQLYSADEIKADAGLAAALTDLINDGFALDKLQHHEEWECIPRFRDAEGIHQMLGDDGVFSVLYDQDMIVACAGAIPWKGGLLGALDANDDGWEVKTVVSKEGYIKQGLASRSTAGLEAYLKHRYQTRESVQTAANLKLWIQAAESLNGAYWRRRGYRDVVVVKQPPGIWGSKAGFTLLVGVKEIAV